MSTIKSHKNMINLYYNSNKKLDKKALALLQNSNKDILAIDVTKTNVTGTQWAGIAQNLNISFESLIDKSSESFKENNVNESNFNNDDWLKILDKSPEVLKFPILIHDDAYFAIEDAQHALKFIEGCSENIDE